MSEMNNPSGENNATPDERAEVLNQQKSAGSPDKEGAVLPPHDDNVNDPPQVIDLIVDIPVKLTVELGRTRMTIKELLRLTQGSIVTLDGLINEPLDILINGYLIAQGEVVVVDDKFGMRITNIITPSERMQRLSRY